MTAFSNRSNEGSEGERVKDRAYDLCFGATNLQKREEIVNQQVLYEASVGGWQVASVMSNSLQP